VDYHFKVTTDGAKADVSVFAGTTSQFSTYADTVPPTSLDVIGPDGVALAGTPSDWNPRGDGATAITAYRRLQTGKLSPGEYTIRYVPVAGETYSVNLDGHDGKQNGSDCTVTKSDPMRNNSGCAEGLYCYSEDIVGQPAGAGTCVVQSKANEGCSTADRRNTHSAQNDECIDGYYCKYSAEATRGDEGWNGYCARDDR
jgi:hypothetical protein